MGKIMNPQNTGLIKYIIELDDGKIETGTPIKFDGKHHGFPVKIFSTKAIQWLYNMAIEHSYWTWPIYRWFTY